MSWNKYLDREDMYKFIDVCRGADEIDGAYNGPVFIREWRITRATFERGLYQIDELRNDPELFADPEDAWEIYRHFIQIPFEDLEGEWTVITYNQMLMDLYRHEDEPNID